MPIGHVTDSLVRSGHRLTGTSMTPETADRWLDAWVVGATGLGLGRTTRLAGWLGVDRGAAWRVDPAGSLVGRDRLRRLRPARVPLAGLQSRSVASAT